MKKANSVTAFLTILMKELGPKCFFDLSVHLQKVTLIIFRFQIFLRSSLLISFFLMFLFHFFYSDLIGIAKFLSLIKDVFRTRI